MKFNHHQLDNGLEIVAECNPAAHSLGLGVFVRTGSRDETALLSGVSHFLEHMVFKGTSRRSADDVNREFDQIGAHYNAYTSEECTVYYAAVLPEYQQPCIDLLTDIMRPSLREADFSMEKKVILEEIQMYADQPPFGMDDRLKELHYDNHPLAQSVLGTSQSVGDLEVGQMQQYFQSHYSPSNLFIAAAGQVDFNQLVEQVANGCSDWQNVPVHRDLTPARISAANSAVHTFHRPSATQQYLLQLADAPASEADDRYAAKLLATILGDDSGSRIYWDLVDPGLVESASLGHYEYQAAGMFYTWVSCQPEDATAIFSQLTQIQQQAESTGFTSQELSQAKNKVKSRVVLGSERPRNRLFNVGGNWMQRREYRSLEEDLAAIEQVTLEDIHKVLAKHPLTRCTTLTIGPLEKF